MRLGRDFAGEGESSKAKGGVTTASADTLRRRMLGKQN